MPAEFHFLQPLWFLALIPLALLYHLLRRPPGNDSAWRKVVDPNLLPLLLSRQGQDSRRLPLFLLAAGWLLTIVALANPVWEKKSLPAFQSQAARVVVLDLSLSMNTQDVKPSRLERARYKVSDILARSKEGQTGLVVFAGDAFMVSPLTTDAGTISDMLRVLDPDIMPVQGSRVDLGLIKAGELLQQAGAQQGDVLLLSDGYDSDLALQAARTLQRQGHTVSVLGIGTETGAPLPGEGGFIRDRNGDMVVTTLDEEALITLASVGGGRYAALTSDRSDIDRLFPASVSRLDSQAVRSEQETEVWWEQGPAVVLLLLPLAALAFRRGWLLSVVMVAGTLTDPGQAMALEWQDLWQRRDQQADIALRAGELGRAGELAQDPLRSGVVDYRQGNYEQSLEGFAGVPGADAAYNRGNALARLGRYEDAIGAYDEALRQQPGMEDAEYNRSLVEELLRQQQEQQEQQEQQAGDSSGQDGEAQQNESSGNGDTGTSRADGSQQEGQEQGDGPDSAQEQADGSSGTQSGDQSSGSGEQAASPDEASMDQSASGAQQQDTQTGKDTDQSGQENSQVAKGGENQFADALEEAAGGQNQGDRDEEVQNGQGGNRDVEPQGSSADEATEQGPGSSAGVEQEALSSEEQLAAEQWLRRIPDDPGGLLRRKFLYQYRQRASDAGNANIQAW